ncbi:MAG: hypothetical protein DHS20C02_18940 [Micavibrio sp.]|nr:MAG: hypothetical protein DHS20C02_18940 [Micavibrio sp.]
MFVHRLKSSIALSGLVVLLFLSGCTGWGGGPVTFDEQFKLLQGDLKALFGIENKLEKPLTLYEAMARGIKYNLDHRLIAMEEVIAGGEINLQAAEIFPSVTAEARHVGRRSDSASSSQSVITGTQSLEPSISTERHRKTASLEASWNVIDAGLAVIRTKQVSDEAQISMERRRKVIHNIIQDVRFAYWQAASSQMLSGRIDQLLEEGKLAANRIQQTEDEGLAPPAETLQSQSRLLEAMHELMVLRSQLSFAKTELASLVNLPPSAEYTLAINEESWGKDAKIPELTVPAEELERIALIIRPEMREEVVMARFATNHVRETILETFPGLEMLVGRNYDSNKFLVDNRWTNFSLGLTQNLIKIFTLPMRFNQAENRVKLAALKRQALGAAVMAQVHVSVIRFKLAEERYQIMQKLHGVNTRMVHLAKSQDIAETLSGAELLEVEMDELLTTIRMHVAHAELQNSYGRLINTLGIDPLPETTENVSTSELAAIIEQRFATLDENTLKNYIGIIQETGKGCSTDSVNETLGLNPALVAHSTYKPKFILTLKE